MHETTWLVDIPEVIEIINHIGNLRIFDALADLSKHFCQLIKANQVALLIQYLKGKITNEIDQRFTLGVSFLHLTSFICYGKKFVTNLLNFLSSLILVHLLFLVLVCWQTAKLSYLHNTMWQLISFILMLGTITTLKYAKQTF